MGVYPPIKDRIQDLNSRLDDQNERIVNLEQKPDRPRLTNHCHECQTSVPPNTPPREAWRYHASHCSRFHARARSRRRPVICGSCECVTGFCAHCGRPL